MGPRIVIPESLQPEVLKSYSAPIRVPGNAAQGKGVGIVGKHKP